MINWIKSLFRPRITEWQKGWNFAESCFESAPAQIAMWRISITELAESDDFQRGVMDYINRRNNP